MTACTTVRVAFIVHRSRRGGFTLVELMVVVALALVTLGLLVPAMGGTREAARKSRCLSNQHGVGQAVEMFGQTRRQANPLTAGVGDSQSMLWHGRTANGVYPGSSYIHYGVLVQQNLLPGAAFTCPSGERWTPAPTVAGGTTYSHQAKQIGVDGQVVNGHYFVRGVNQSAATSFMNVPVRTALMIDSTRPDLNQANHSAGANALYYDGAARWVPTAGASQTINQTSRTHWRKIDEGKVE